MSKEDIINYVMTTPGNPNRAVLSGMLDSIADAGGGNDFIVNFTTNDGMNYTADKTYTEISDALVGGKNVWGISDGPSGLQNFPNVHQPPFGFGISFLGMFTNITSTSTTFSIHGYVIDQSNEVSVVGQVIPTA